MSKILYPTRAQEAKMVTIGGSFELLPSVGNIVGKGFTVQDDAFFRLGIVGEGVLLGYYLVQFPFAFKDWSLLMGLGSTPAEAQINTKYAARSSTASLFNAPNDGFFVIYADSLTDNTRGTEDLKFSFVVSGELL